jgi:hypothetical protein
LKIQRHRNGTFSITEITAADMDNLSFAASSATAFYAEGADPVRSCEWTRREYHLYDRLYRYLKRTTETRSPLTLKLVSAQNDGVINDQVYNQAV